MTVLDESVFSDHSASALRAEAWASWREKALCNGLAKLYYSDDSQDQQKALDLCAACPVRLTHCRPWVLSLPPKEDPSGVCAGWTEGERTTARIELLMSTATTTVKQCRACWDWRARADYSPDKRSTDGLQPYCKPCTAARIREFRQRKAAAA